jgi:transcriptional regulator with XRE-family HTH domain
MGEYRNPLAVAVGRALLLLRDDQHLTPAQLASELDLKPATYRLIESGFAPLIPSYSLQLAKVFQRQKLDWHRVALLLVATQLLDQSRKDLERMRAVAKELESADPELGKLLREIDWNRVSTARTPSELAEDLEKKQIPARLIEEYMTGGGGPEESGEVPEIGRSMAKTLSQLSPLYYEGLYNLADLLQYFRPHVAPEALLHWEDSHVDRIQRIYGLVRFPEQLQESVRDLDFLWSYILRDSFEGLFIIWMPHSDHRKAFDSKQLERELNTQMSAYRDALIPAWCRRKRGLRAQQLALRFKEAVHWKLISEDDGRAHDLRSLLKYDLKSGQLQPRESVDGADQYGGIENLHNLWLYILKQPQNLVAFADNSKPGLKDQYISVLISWKSARDAMRTLQRLWEGELARLKLRLIGP